MPKTLTRARPRPLSSACEVTERGPNWLFVRLAGEPPEDVGELAEELWQITRRHLTTRLVIEIDAKHLRAGNEQNETSLGTSLRALQDRLVAAGGALRICGMRPDQAHRVLAAAHCAALHNHATRHDAVTGACPLDG